MTTTTKGPTSTLSRPMVDVSAYQHPTGQDIDWSAVAHHSYGVAMIKGSEGVDYVNPWARIDAEAARRAMIETGGYHFAHPELNTPQAEAAHALSVFDGIELPLGIACDLESGSGLGWAVIGTWAVAFHDEIKKMRPLCPLYLDEDYLANIPGAPWDYYLWLAATRRPRRQVWAWQETTPGKVDGIVGPVDIGTYYGP